MTLASQLWSSRASLDCVNPMNSAEETRSDTAWPLNLTWPLIFTWNRLEDWPNSNQGPANDHDITSEWIQQASANITSHTVPRATIDKYQKNQFTRELPLPNNQATYLSGPICKHKTPRVTNPLRFMFRTPLSSGFDARFAQLDRLARTQNTSANSVAAPDSTISKSIKESKAIKEDFSQSLSKPTEVQSRLAREQ